jgi:hypothetical protein
MDDEIEDLNKKIEDQSEKIIYYKSSLSNEQNKNYELEKKNQEMKKTLEELQKAQKVQKETTRITRHTSRDFRPKASKVENNETSNINEFDMKDITPNKYTIVKCVEIEELKWYLFRKNNNRNIIKKFNQRPMIPNKTIYYSRHEKLKTNMNANETNTKDLYSDYIWRPMINQKDFDSFGPLPQSEVMDDKNKISEMEKEIKELKYKFIKKEDDYNRININYAKLLKKSKNPDSKEKLLETINKLKTENKNLNNTLLKYKTENNIIAISFIEDDLESSFFVDDFCFDTILSELDKAEDKFMAMNNNIQKGIKTFNFKKKIKVNKLEDKKEEEKDENEIKDEKEENDSDI